MKEGLLRKTAMVTAVAATLAGGARSALAESTFTTGTQDFGAVTINHEGKTVSALTANEAAGLSFVLKSHAGPGEECIFESSDADLNLLKRMKVGDFLLDIKCRKKEPSYAAVPADGEPTVVYVDGERKEVAPVVPGLLVDANARGPIEFRQNLNGMVIVGQEQKLVELGDGRLIEEDRMAASYELTTVFEHKGEAVDTLFGTVAGNLAYGTGLVLPAVVAGLMGAYDKPEGDEITQNGGDQYQNGGDQYQYGGDQYQYGGDKYQKGRKYPRRREAPPPPPDKWKKFFKDPGPKGTPPGPKGGGPCGGIPVGGAQEWYNNKKC